MSAPVTVTVDPSRGIGRIDDGIYGHFLESNFFGNIEGGVRDESSPQAHPVRARWPGCAPT